MIGNHVLALQHAVPATLSGTCRPGSGCSGRSDLEPDASGMAAG